jgi:hypothetical protein
MCYISVKKFVSRFFSQVANGSILIIVTYIAHTIH